MSKSFTANTKINFDPSLEAVEFGAVRIELKVLRATANLPTRMAAFVQHEDFHPTRSTPRTKEPILVIEIEARKVPTFGQFATLAREAARAAGLKGGHLVQNKVYITPPWWKKAEHHQGMLFHFVTSKGLIKV
jgi:hypothetical protein